MENFNIQKRLNNIYSGEKTIKPEDNSQQANIQHRIKIALIKAGSIPDGTFGVVTKTTFAIKQSNKFVKFD